MKREYFFYDLLWFVAGPMLIAGGLFNFTQDHLGDHFFYAYQDGAVIAIVIGVGLVATGLVRRRRIEHANVNE